MFDSALVQNSTTNQYTKLGLMFKPILKLLKHRQVDNFANPCADSFIIPFILINREHLSWRPSLDDPKHPKVPSIADPLDRTLCANVCNILQARVKMSATFSKPGTHSSTARCSRKASWTQHNLKSICRILLNNPYMELMFIAACESLLTTGTAACPNTC